MLLKMSNPLPSVNLSSQTVQLFIQILNQQYDDNQRNIASLIQSNNDIRTMLSYLLTQRLLEPAIGERGIRQGSPATASLQASRQRSSGHVQTPTARSVQPIGQGQAPGQRQGRDLFLDPAPALGFEPDRGLLSTLLTQLLTPSNFDSISISGVTLTPQNFMEPVVINPTPQQIEIATRRVRYREIVRPINTQCPISMETFTDDETVTIIRQCGHIFNTDNITQWFTRHCLCPVCRFDIREYRPQAPRQTHSSDESSTDDEPEDDDMVD